MSKLYTIFHKALKPLNLEVNLGDKEMTEQEKEFFHPVRFVQLMHNGQRVGEIAEVHPRIVNRFGTKKRVSILEIDLETLRR